MALPQTKEFGAQEAFRIVVDGSHCAGKTTLMNMLAADPDLAGFTFMAETAKRIASGWGIVERQQLAELLACRRRYDEFLLAIHNAQLLEEMRNPRFVSDSSLFRNLAYALAVKRGEEIFDFDFGSHSYDLVLYCPIEFAFVGNDFRFEPLRTDVDAILRRLLERFGQRVIELSGSPEIRFQQAITAIRKLFTGSQ